MYIPLFLVLIIFLPSLIPFIGLLLMWAFTLCITYPILGILFIINKFDNIFRVMFIVVFCLGWIYFLAEGILHSKNRKNPIKTEQVVLKKDYSKQAEELINKINTYNQQEIERNQINLEYNEIIQKYLNN